MPEELKRKRISLFILGSVGIFFLFLWKNAELQLIYAEEYQRKVEQIITREIPLVAPRGEVFDRNYKTRKDAIPLILNKSILSLLVIPAQFPPNELEKEIEELEALLEYPKGMLSARLKKVPPRSKKQVVLIEELKEEEVNRLLEVYPKFSRFLLLERNKRIYPLGEKAAHITGYIGAPSSEDLKKRGVYPFEKVGKNGIELYYDSLLRGSHGKLLQLRTKEGVLQKVLEKPIPGNNLILTIDAKMQELAYSLLQGRRGAIVALKPATGEILALVSSPSYDPNLLVSKNKKIREEHLRYIHQVQAEFNRAISGTYPPASTFKTLVALAGLEEGRISPNTIFTCRGKHVVKSSYAFIPDKVFYCWDVHGRCDLFCAISQSCSSYFYRLGTQLGVHLITKYAKYFGLHEKTGIDLPGEKAGLIPTPLWKEKKFHTSWYEGDTVNLSIGQGFIQVTIMEMLNLYAAIVTGGIVYKPHLLKEIRYPTDDSIRKKYEKEILLEVPISPSTVEFLQEALHLTTTEGTARGVFRWKGVPPSAGKTGTVQTISGERFAKKTQHAWFIGFSPYKAPVDKILLVGVFVEYGIAGAIGAAPIARELFIYWQEYLKKIHES